MVKLKAMALDREYEIRLWTRPGLDAYFWRRKACVASESHGPAAEEGGSPEERRDAVSSEVEIKHVNCSWEGRGGRKRGRGEREKGERRKWGETMGDRVQGHLGTHLRLSHCSTSFAFILPHLSSHQRACKAVFDDIRMGRDGSNARVLQCHGVTGPLRRGTQCRRPIALRIPLLKCTLIPGGVPRNWL